MRYCTSVVVLNFGGCFENKKFAGIAIIRFQDPFSYLAPECIHQFTSIL